MFHACQTSGTARGADMKRNDILAVSIANIQTISQDVITLRLETKDSFKLVDIELNKIRLLT